jgi:hypothetical protein
MDAWQKTILFEKIFRKKSQNAAEITHQQRSSAPMSDISFGQTAWPLQCGCISNGNFEEANEPIERMPLFG